MKLQPVILVILAVFLACSSATAQSEKKLIKEAEKAYDEGEKKVALDYYLQAHRRNPKNYETNLKIGKLYLEGTYKFRSLDYLENALELKGGSEELHRYLGMAYHYNHQFDEAIIYYNKYKEEQKDEGQQLWAARKVKECETGKKLVSDPVDVEIKNLGGNVNSEFPEYAPIVSADESLLLFTSKREGSTGELVDHTGNYYEDIYIAKKQDNGEWGHPRSISSVINTNYHDASIGLSPDGKTLYTYKDDRKNNGNIYESRLRKDGTWSKPKELDDPVNTKKHYENAIAVTPDGNKIYFTSDRPGGYGGLDLYESTLKSNGEWGEPKNLGERINTEGEEESPFLDLDGKTLYFISNRHETMGGYDIFKSTYNEETEEWSKPENLGYPINSADEEFSFTLSGDGTHAYIGSAKESGAGETDIYLIKMPPREDYEQLVTKVEAISGKKIVRKTVEEVKPEPELMPVIVKGHVQEIGKGNPLQAKVQILDSARNVIYDSETPGSGDFTYNVSSEKEGKYTVTAEKKGYGFTSRTIDIPARTTKEEVVYVDLGLKKLDVGSRFILRNIYFDFDKATLKPSSEEELQKLLKLLQENPDMKVEIAGHTDNFGSGTYNKDLSQRRARAVVEYLTGNGIPQKRLVAKGYGESRPLASNDDEKDGREINRRTEFEVLDNK